MIALQKEIICVLRNGRKLDCGWCWLNTRRLQGPCSEAPDSTERSTPLQGPTLGMRSNLGNSCTGAAGSNAATASRLLQYNCGSPRPLAAKRFLSMRSKFCWPSRVTGSLRLLHRSAKRPRVHGRAPWPVGTSSTPESPRSSYAWATFCQPLLTRQDGYPRRQEPPRTLGHWRAL